MPATSAVVQATRSGEVPVFLGGTAGTMRLVGPTPRIVRSTTLGSLTAGFHTDVAELIEVSPDPGREAQAAPAAQTLAGIITQQLQASDGSWQQGTLTPWNPATNGSVDWWDCTAGSSPTDCASVTMTRDAIQEGFGRTTPDENPVGPTSDATHPGSILPSSSDVTSWMWIAAIGVGLYIFWPVLLQLIGQGRARAEYAAARRRNPHGHRRHRRYHRAA